MMFDVRSASALRCGVLLGVLSVSLCASPLSAADLDVGSGQSYETISAALQDAADGDRVVVHNGTYEEKIVWIKDVDIVEAEGETAVLLGTDAVDPIDPEIGPTSFFLIEIVDGADFDRVWDGIDIVIDGSRLSRVVLERFNDPDATTTFRNLSVTDGPNASGGGRIFTAEHSDLTVENVNVNLTATGSYEMFVGAMGTTDPVSTASLTATNCNFNGPVISCVGTLGDASRIVLNNCVLSKTSGGIHTQIDQGIVTFNDCYFTGPACFRGLLTGGSPDSAPATITMNGCKMDPTPAWWAITIERSVNLTARNCCFPSFSEFVIINTASAGNLDTTVTLEHCTFAFLATGGPRSGIRDESIEGSAVTYNVENCLFFIPGSTTGAIQANNSLGTVIVNADENFVSENTNSPLPGNGGLLTGEIVGGDPRLSEIDGCHITSDLSDAVNSAADIGFDEDLDHDERSDGDDFGADEFGSLPDDPGLPIGLTAAPDDETVLLGWLPPSGPTVAVAGYNVYQVAPGPRARVNGLLVTGLSVPISGLVNNTEHCFVVTSVGVSGNESADSDQICTTPAPAAGLTDLKVDDDFAADDPASLEFTTIQAAMNFAVDAENAAGAPYQIVVFSGEYDEKIFWTDDVDIVEAPGETAIYRPTNASSDDKTFSEDFNVQIIIDAPVTVNWRGIDMVYDSNLFSRFIISRFGQATVNFRDFSVTDTAGAGGLGQRVFTLETRGTMNIDNVDIDLQGSSRYGIVFGAMTENTTINVSNCDVSANLDGKVLSAERGVNTFLNVDNCALSGTGGGFIADLNAGTVTLNNCTFDSPRGLSRGFVMRGFGNLSLTINSCTWMPGPDWWCIVSEKNTQKVFLNNCCFLRDPGTPTRGRTPFSILHVGSFAPGSTTYEITHCTFAATQESPFNTAIRLETQERSDLELVLDNNIFYLPGSTVGVIESTDSNVGNNEVIASTNLRFTEPEGLPLEDLLEEDPAGTIISGDPQLGLGEPADLCHIGDGSEAIDRGIDTGLTVDLDGGVRPAGDGPDLGADEIGTEGFGACCLPTAECTALLASECADQGGSFQGNGVNCEGVACFIPLRRADCDQSGKVDFNDAIFHLRFLFLGENEALVNGCRDACDSDDSGADDFTDDINTLQFLFLGQGEIPDPGPRSDDSHPCGPDTTADELVDCSSYAPAVACP